MTWESLACIFSKFIDDFQYLLFFEMVFSVSQKREDESFCFKL